MRARAPRRREERGAIAVVAALSMSVLLVVAAFVVDIGMQRVARRDMQSVADMVALDLSRELDGRSVATLTPLLPGLAEAARARNSGTVGATPQVTVELGSLATTGGFTAITSGVPTAVRVTATTRVPFAFGIASGGGAGATAVAAAQTGGCLRVGSYVASLDSAQSNLLNRLLGSYLGSSVALSALSYNGLIGSTVKLSDLVQVGGLGVASVDELLALKNVKVATLLTAAATVLDRQGTTQATAAAAALRGLTVAAATPTIALADLVKVAPGSGAAADVGLNALDLLTAAASIANRGNAVAISNLGFTLPGVASAGPLTVRVVEGPQVQCGGVGTEAHSAQVQVSLPVRIDQRSLTVPGVGAVTVKATTFTVTADLGQASARLLGVTCTNGVATSVTAGLRSSVVGGITVSGATGVKVSLGTTGVDSGLLGVIKSVLGMLSTVQVDLDTDLGIRASTPIVPYERSTPVTLPVPGSYTTPVGSSSGAVLGGGLALDVTGGARVTVTARLLGLLGLNVSTYGAGDAIFDAVVNPVLGQITSVVLNPVITSLQDNLIAPLAKLLGVQVAGADVFAVPTPTCTNPVLRG